MHKFRYSYSYGFLLALLYKKYPHSSDVRRLHNKIEINLNRPTARVPCEQYRRTDGQSIHGVTINQNPDAVKITRNVVCLLLFKQVKIHTSRNHYIKSMFSTEVR